MELPATVAAEQGLLRQNVALSLVKQSADQAQALAEMIDQSARSAPVSNARGTNVDVSA